MVGINVIETYLGHEDVFYIMSYIDNATYYLKISFLRWPERAIPPSMITFLCSTWDIRNI